MVYETREPNGGKQGLKEQEVSVNGCELKLKSPPLGGKPAYGNGRSR